MGVCLVLVGCGSSPPTPSPEAPPNNERSGSNPEPDPGDPSEGDTPPANAGTPSPLEAEPSLPARACIPWTYSTLPVQATACASDAVFPDGTSQHARYDADSHPLEVRTLTASRALSQVDTQIWRDGLQRLQRTDRPDGSFNQKEWTYNVRANLERRVFTSNTNTTSFDFTYDAQGRISQVVTHDNSNPDDITSHYTYDAAGRLVSIDSSGDCGREEDTRCATLTYWPNGRLKQHDGEKGRVFLRDDYDELGQLVSSKVIDDQVSTESTRAYDPAGRLVRLREGYKASGAETDTSIETLTTTAYDDPAGRRERLARDKSVVCVDCGPDNSDTTEWTSTRVTHRTTFLCDTQLVALEEWDSDEDGVVDAQRTHERDATGRLVREVYSGTPGLDNGPVTLDFHYDCR